MLHVETRAEWQANNQLFVFNMLSLNSREKDQIPVTACILMLGGSPPWVQATLRAVRGCPICADPYYNTAITDERSCGKFIASNDWSVQSQSLNKPHLNTGHKLYTVSVNEVTVTVPLFHGFAFTSEEPNATPASTASTEKGSCWSWDFLLSLWLRTQSVYSGFRKLTHPAITGVHIAFHLRVIVKKFFGLFFFFSLSLFLLGGSRRQSAGLFQAQNNFWQLLRALRCFTRALSCHPYGRHYGRNITLDGLTGSSITWGFAQYWKINVPFPLNNLRPLQENRGGFVHSFTRRQTETGALTKVADRGKVHSVAGSRFTVAVLRADYQVTSVSSGPAFRRWWPLTPALCRHRSNCSVPPKAFPSRSGVCPGPHRPGSQRGCPPFTSAASAHHNTQAITKHVPAISFGFKLRKCETFIFVENKGCERVKPNQRSIAFIDSYDWS